MRRWLILVPLVALLLTGCVPKNMATYQVGASSDDAAQTVTTNAVTLADNGIQMSTAAGDAAYTGFRFTGIGLNNAETVGAAFLDLALAPQFAAQNAIDLTLYAEAADNAATFTTGASNISNRARTTASVVWTGTAPNNAFTQSPNIAALIQEVVNRAGWVSGNAINIIAVANSASVFGCTTWEGAQGAAPDQAKLEVIGPATALPGIAHHA